MDPDDPASWYKQQQVKEGQRPPHGPGGMVEIYQSQSLWDNRQHPRVHGAFAQIWGTEKLWCSMDRANMKPPVREDQPAWQHPGMIHWDADTTSGQTTFRVQGVLYLADTDENGGGFRESSTQFKSCGDVTVSRCVCRMYTRVSSQIRRLAPWPWLADQEGPTITHAALASGSSHADSWQGRRSADCASLANYYEWALAGNATA